MSESETRILAALAGIEVLEDACPIRKLAGGPASDSWLLEAGGQRFVARFDNATAGSLGLDRQAESEILQTVSEAGIAPQLVWSDPGRGIQVCTWIEGDSWSMKDIHHPARLQELALTLRKLHELPPLGRRFEPEAAAQHYANQIGTPEASELAGHAGALAAKLRAETTRPALCHNDLVHSNIVNHGPVYLIDWEYAAVGDAYFDLAVVVRHHQLSPALSKIFLQAYFENPGPAQFEKLAAFCSLYDYLAGLWYLAMARESGASPAIETELGRVMARLAQP
ncbi:phosphotransferase [Pseudomonadota bacterium]